MTYREAILLGESILQKAKIVDAKNDAWLLLAMACRINHTYYYVHMDEEMSQEQIREYQALLSKRAERIPLQYIVGEQEFMGLKFREQQCAHTASGYRDSCRGGTQGDRAGYESA